MTNSVIIQHIVSKVYIFRKGIDNLCSRRWSLSGYPHQPFPPGFQLLIHNHIQELEMSELLVVTLPYMT